MYGHNHLIAGMYYKVFHSRGKMDIMPFGLLEIPLDVGDEISDFSAPQGIEAKLAMEDFRERYGSRVSRVKVCEGIILSRRASFDHHTLIWDRYNTLKYAQKMQSEAAVRERARIEGEAIQRAYDANNVHVGKYHMTMAEAIREHGIEPGWFVREKGHTVWSEVTMLGDSLVFGFRAFRRCPNLLPKSYSITSETFHPTLKHLIFRKELADCDNVVRADTFKYDGIEYQAWR